MPLVRSRGSQQIDNVLDGGVGLVVSGFEFAVGAVRWVGLVLEAAIGQRAAEPFVEEQEQERDLDSFGGELVSIAGAIALQDPVAFQFS